MPRNNRQSPTSRQAPVSAPTASVPGPAGGSRRNRGPKASHGPEPNQNGVSQPAQAHYALRSRSRGNLGVPGSTSDATSVAPSMSNSRAPSGSGHSRRATSGSTQTSFDDAASTSVSGLSLYGDDDDRLTSISSIDLGKDDAAPGSDEETFTYQASNDAKAVIDGDDIKAEPSDEDETFVYRPSAKAQVASARPSLLPAASIDVQRARAYSPRPMGPYRPPIQSSFAPRTSPYLVPVQHGAPPPLYPPVRRHIGPSPPPGAMMPMLGGPGFGPPVPFGPPRIAPVMMQPGGSAPLQHPHPLLMAPMQGPPPMLASFLEENAKRKRNISSQPSYTPAAVAPAYQPMPPRSQQDPAQMSPLRATALPAPQTTPGGSNWPTFKPFDTVAINPPTPQSLVSPAPVDPRSLGSRPMWQDESPGAPLDPWGSVLSAGRDGSNSAASWSPASNPVGKRIRLDDVTADAEGGQAPSRVLPPPPSVPGGSIW